jgi:hypothetical protein
MTYQLVPIFDHGSENIRPVFDFPLCLGRNLVTLTKENLASALTCICAEVDSFYSEGNYYENIY